MRKRIDKVFLVLLNGGEKKWWDSARWRDVDPDIIFVNNTREIKGKHDPVMSHYIKRNDRKIERRTKQRKQWHRSMSLLRLSLIETQETPGLECCLQGFPLSFSCFWTHGYCGLDGKCPEWCGFEPGRKSNEEKRNVHVRTEVFVSREARIASLEWMICRTPCLMHKECGRCGSSCLGSPRPLSPELDSWGIAHQASSKCKQLFTKVQVLHMHCGR